MLYYDANKGFHANKSKDSEVYNILVIVSDYSHQSVIVVKTLVMAFGMRNIAIINVKRAKYCCSINVYIREEATSLSKNFMLNDKGSR